MVNKNLGIFAEKNNSFYVFAVFKAFEDECGLVYSETTIERIVGGSQVNDSLSWPSKALIIFTYSSYFTLPTDSNNVTIQFTSKYVCGGSLINRRTSRFMPKFLSNKLLSSSIKFLFLIYLR
jgi:hypothetical protein